MAIMGNISIHARNSRPTCIGKFLLQKKKKIIHLTFPGSSEVLYFFFLFIFLGEEEGGSVYKHRSR